MDERLREAFDAIHADEGLKARTRACLAARRTPVRRRLLAAAAALCLLLAAGAALYAVPTAYLSIDLNPSMELGINRFDRVVSVRSYNEDGDALADALDLRFRDYRDALEAVLAEPAVAEALGAGGVMTLTVAGEDGGRQAAILDAVQSCTASQSNVRCQACGMEELQEARRAGMSLGRYRALRRLQELDPSVTAEDVEGLTIAQIHAWIAALGGSPGSGRGHRHGWER